MFLRAIGLIAVITPLFLGVPSYAKDSTTNITGIRLYSSMSFVKTEGEFYGLEIVLVPYSRGLKVLWRSGSGRLDPPLLLDAIQETNQVKVIVPETNDLFGEWTLSQNGRLLHAKGPRDLHFDLKEHILK
jgi:hypothetical protein